MNMIKKITATAFLMLSCATISHAGIYTLLAGNGAPFRGDVVVQIWDSAMVMRTQFNVTGPRLIFEGPQYPGSGPYTMVIYAGNKEIWRGRVSRSDGQGEDNGRIIQISG